MKKILVVLLFLGVMMGFLFFPAQAQVTGRPTETEALIKRIQDLEKDVNQLQKEMAGAKLVVTGLDKSLGKLKSDFEGHSHRLHSTMASWDALEKTHKAGQNPHLPALYPNQLKAQQAEKGAVGFYTSPPLKSN
ncbi:MAG: hypothetical protein Q6J44_07140 [Gloeomargarita sp. DG02_4_bins_56]